MCLLQMTTYNVSNSGLAAYIIDGASNPTLNLIRGSQYTFEVNASGHPFWIQTTTQPYNANNVYNSGITNNGVQVGNLVFNVPLDAPNTLYYVCQVHPQMNGIINITNDNTICFKEGAKILTNNGYIPIQELRNGDLVKTLLHGYKKIDMIGKREMYHPATSERIKDQLYQCSPSEYPEVFESLVVTGCHSILVDEFICTEQREKTSEVLGYIYVTDNNYRLPACVDERASVYEIPGNYTIYHFALEHDDYYMNYGIYANGLLVETCSKRNLTELSNMTLIE